jgi:hypothetical protein
LPVIQDPRSASMDIRGVKVGGSPE